MGKVKLLLCMLIVISMGKENWDSIAGKLCLQCLCLSMTNCNTSFGCQGNSDSYACGPFSITFGYWIDSAYPVLKEEADIGVRGYARCVNDLECGKRAVEKYMNKFGRGPLPGLFISSGLGWLCKVPETSAVLNVQTILTRPIPEEQDHNDVCDRRSLSFKVFEDCNGDGVINCYDYFGVHFFGFVDCINQHPLTTEETIFHRCMKNTADPH